MMFFLIRVLRPHLSPVVPRVQRFVGHAHTEQTPPTSTSVYQRAFISHGVCFAQRAAQPSRDAFCNCIGRNRSALSTLSIPAAPTAAAAEQLLLSQLLLLLQPQAAIHVPGPPARDGQNDQTWSNDVAGLLVGLHHVSWATLGLEELGIRGVNGNHALDLCPACATFFWGWIPILRAMTRASSTC